MKRLTLAFLVSDQAVCLALKKRGFGAGKWNGYGGKLEPNETPEAAVIREIAEESRVHVRPEALEPVAEHEFLYPTGTHFVHVYLVRQWQGDPIETEEMRPQWYDFADIPYQSMWADDIHWLPQVLAGARVKGWVRFDEGGETIAEMAWHELND